jgi:hypothetical protein
MDLPTIEEARAVKTEIIARLAHLENFLGAGIGQRDGRWIVRVNWRQLPLSSDLQSHVGNVEIVHSVTGKPRPQGD